MGGLTHCLPQDSVTLVSKYYFSMFAGAMSRRSVMLWASPTLSYFLRVKLAWLSQPAHLIFCGERANRVSVGIGHATGKLAGSATARLVTWRGWRSHAKHR
jgi:hypothetical protein